MLVYVTNVIKLIKNSSTCIYEVANMGPGIFYHRLDFEDVPMHVWEIFVSPVLFLLCILSTALTCGLFSLVSGDCVSGFAGAG